MDTLCTRHDVGAEQEAARRQLKEQVAALVDAAPPLTPEQASRLRLLLALPEHTHLLGGELRG